MDAAHYAHPTVLEFLLAKGATISGTPSSGWSFDITARRIGFADEVLREEERKAQVLKLLVDAEAKVHKLREEQSAAPMQAHPAATRSPMGSAAPLSELPVPLGGSPHPPQQPFLPQGTTRLEAGGSAPSELITRLCSLSSAS